VMVEGIARRIDRGEVAETSNGGTAPQPQ